MRLPNHILLDFSFSKSSSTSQYWITELSNSSFPNRPIFLNNEFLCDKYLTQVSYKTNLLSEVKKNVTYIQNYFTSDVYKSVFVNQKEDQNIPAYSFFNLNFLKKERLYTKLKYSRSPAYDIVSGGAAALFAGLLGFLISEKFGFELVDSGDFYYLFMYLVFATFFIRPFLVVSNSTNSLYSVFSPKLIFSFYKNVVLLVFKTFKY